MSGNLEQARAFYSDAEVRNIRVDDASIAVRVYGSGPALVFVHGYPVHGYTWRKLLPILSVHFSCYVVDLPGLGDSEWNSDTDFTFTAQARRLNLLFEKLKLREFSIIAHDTGATIARLAIVERPNQVTKLILLNTEIPNHRPPWIRFYQLCAKLPLSAYMFKLLLQSDLFVRSSMGLGQFYADKKRLRQESPTTPYLEPLRASHHKMQGMLSYLLGIEWSVVDALVIRHREILCDTLLLWGARDGTFPADLAEAMQEQFSCRTAFIRLENAALMPHEEQPQDVLKYTLEFMEDLTLCA